MVTRNPLNPILDVYIPEANLAGRIVLSYGELELLVTYCLGNAIRDLYGAMRAIFRILGEMARISMADALMREAFEKQGLGPQYADAIGATKFCVTLRNQYAHCTWWEPT